MKNSLPLYNTYRYRLSQTELFKGLPFDMLDDMLAHFRLETWKKGSVHDSRIAVSRFYVVVDGRMELSQAHPVTGKQMSIIILSPGDVYDVLSLLDGSEHNVIPEALDDLQLFSAPIEAVRKWIQIHPEFNRSFMPYLAKRIRLQETLVTDLALYDTDTRLARLILRYAATDELPEGGNEKGLDVPLLHGLSNEKLAQMIGSARQVVNRHLQAMKREGVLHTENHRLIIDDLRKLRSRADMMQAAYQP